MYNVVCLAESKDEKNLEDVKKIIKEYGKIKEENEVGEMPLAFEIDEKSHGFYFWIDFELKKGENNVDKLKEKLDESDLLRYLISKKPEEALTVEKEKAEKERKKAKKKAKKTKEKKQDKDEKPKKKKAKKPKTKKSKKEKKKEKEEPEEDEEKRMEDLDKKLEDIL